MTTSAGVKLVYGTATVAGDGTITFGSTWTHIPGIQSFPSLGAAPQALDATTTDDLVYMKYEQGLIDLGGSLEFTALRTTALVDACDNAMEAPTGEGALRAFAIEYPAPLSERWMWVGELAEVGPGEVGVNAVITSTLSISQGSAPEAEAITD